MLRGMGEGAGRTAYSYVLACIRQVFATDADAKQHVHVELCPISVNRPRWVACYSWCYRFTPFIFQVSKSKGGWNWGWTSRLKIPKFEWLFAFLSWSRTFFKLLIHNRKYASFTTFDIHTCSFSLYKSLFAIKSLINIITYWRETVRDCIW